MKNFSKFVLTSFAVLVSAPLFAVGSTVLANSVHYTAVPGASFVLQAGTSESELGNNVTIGTTSTQCPVTFTPKVSTSLSDTNAAQKSSCPIDAIHASGGAVVPNGNGYSVVIGDVQIDSAMGCDLRGLKLNWTVYCMMNKSA